MGCEIKSPPMKDRTHDLGAMLDAVDERTNLVLIANPNNPTGTYNTHRDIEAFMEKVPEYALVVVDEAYKEFVDEKDYASSVDLMPRFPNLMVTGTFSKVYGLAGLRIGYAFAQPDVFFQLNKIRSPFNTNVPAQVGAIAALEDQRFARKFVRINRVKRNFVCAELQNMGLAIMPTVTNFVLLDVPTTGRDFFEKLLRDGVIVRPMVGWGFPNSVRVSFHTRAGNERFLAATRKALEL